MYDYENRGLCCPLFSFVIVLRRLEMKKIVKILAVVLPTMLITMTAKAYCSTPEYTTMQVLNSFFENRTYIFDYDEKIVYKDEGKKHSITENGCFMFDSQNSSLRLTSHFTNKSKTHHFSKTGKQTSKSTYYVSTRKNGYLWSEPKKSNMSYWSKVLNFSSKDIHSLFEYVDDNKEEVIIDGTLCKSITCKVNCDTFSDINADNVYVTFYYSGIDYSPVRLELKVSGSDNDLDTLLKNYFFVNKDISCSEYEYRLSASIMLSNEELEIKRDFKHEKEQSVKEADSSKKSDSSKQDNKDSVSSKAEGKANKEGKRSKSLEKEKTKNSTTKKTKVYKVAPIE